ncbi:MAG: 1-(5-phosphoribosyl)-5-[(5-phosphoribosylamino)methylideneamino] imidazole-4-carboxamide isomerase [Chloroflexi bacterium]|nr:1-(5-phosphoribosyl)-5-[(5-phosphoribosylamino)methylideneamino] imidazole-4-carboxamide isomerase [Chloroflexota bacterium]
MRVWDIYPAMDLRRGRVVRLKQGDPGRETRYGDDPLAVARTWQAAGATWLHVVNLDGAFGEGSSENEMALKRLLTAGLRIQFGGGVRDLESLRRVLNLGVERVVLGTVAVEDPSLVEAAAASWPEGVAVAIDVLEGSVQTRGWRQGTAVAGDALIRQCIRQGVRWVIVTDVARDGMGTGLDLAMAQQAQQSGLQAIASGGISAIVDVERAFAAGLSGVIIGRALYEGQIRLEDALRIGAPGLAGLLVRPTYREEPGGSLQTGREGHAG